MNDETAQIKKALGKEYGFIRTHYHVQNIGIFGSFVHGDFTPQSDVDLLVEFSRPISLFTFIELEDYLAQKLMKKVDLVSKKSLKPAIREGILSEAVYV